MEYSVHDLLRILWRKWYIIVIALVVVPLIAILISRLSYKSAVKNYEKLTQECLVTTTDVGTTVMPYQYGYEVKQGFAQAYQTYAQTSSDQPLLTEQEYAELLFDQMRSKIIASLDSDYVLYELEYKLQFAGFQEPDTLDDDNNVVPDGRGFMLKKHFSVNVGEGDSFEVKITGVEQEDAKIILVVYNQILLAQNADEIIEFVLYPQPETFELTRVVATDNAVLANQVMASVPDAPPSILKTGVISAAFGAAFACFFVLLVAFVGGKKEESKKSDRFKDA